MEVNLLILSSIAFIAGIPAAWAFGKFLLAVEARKARRAAVWDMIIMTLSTLVTLTLWSRSGDSMFVFVGYIMGNGAGTYLVVKLEQIQDKRAAKKAAKSA